MTDRADVVVVGGGIIGLTAAVRLRERGARVTLLAADDPADTVSAVAAAVWYPSHTEADPRVLRWARETQAELGRQAAAGVPGVVARPTRMLLRRPWAGPPWWAAATADLVTTPGAGPYSTELRFTAPTVEMPPYLRWLRERFAGAGGRLLRGRLDRLTDGFALAPTVVNATGLAAGRLADDPAVHPVRGQLVLVANPGLTTSVRDEDNPAGITYVHPRRHDVVLGGTFEPGEWDTRPDPATSAAIRRRCMALVPELATAPVLGERVGLRPARHGGPRVAVAPGSPPGRRLVHAYGHGGAGVTLSWGCAAEVARLALDGADELRPAQRSTRNASRYAQ
ncbi:FAD-dependent oxidoreductase [Micromonospora sp. 4G57]|uniref:D-amino-acid oxidase n=1 Tax=Micromonospora sicca TaxID=2202420 RepID=A0ABU5JJ62_9ACTN|nr:MULTISPECIES: FAD-dependent oxidoreductase [unclassified Micromonospora]MDZ5442819.1 FAD-dependent oxidoreductase [Micromonospora sp. 4G57]MDZ5492631.1 FAD-dependent oxidoreductase [Micromonospora sp. 4G53]